MYAVAKQQKGITTADNSALSCLLKKRNLHVKNSREKILKRKRKLQNQLINFDSLFINEDKHIGEIKYKTLLQKTFETFFSLKKKTNKQKASQPRDLQSVERLFSCATPYWHVFLFRHVSL